MPTCQGLESCDGRKRSAVKPGASIVHTVRAALRTQCTVVVPVPTAASYGRHFRISWPCASFSISKLFRRLAARGFGCAGCVGGRSRQVAAAEVASRVQEKMAAIT